MIVVDVQRVADSCGFGVPLMEYVGERDMLPDYADRKGAEGRADYRRRKNSVSLDGFPAFDFDPLPDPEPSVRRQWRIALDRLLCSAR